MKQAIPLRRRGWRVVEGFVPPADIPVEQLWTPAAVQGRLIEAARVVERTGGRVLPKEYGNSMPAYMHDWGDLIGQAANDTLHAGGNRITIGATSRTMTRVEQAMRWLWRYLDDYEGQRRVLRLFLRCRATRVPFSVALKRKGWNKATAYRARDRALTIIAIGLIRDRVPLVLARSDDDDRDD